MAERGVARELFRNRVFVRLFLGHMVSNLGTSFSYIALMAKYYDLTHSALGWAFLAATRALPYGLLGPVAGYLADRLDRRKIIFASDLARFVLFAYLGFCRDTTTFFALTFLIGVFDTAYEPAHRSLLTLSLEKRLLLGANSVEETVRGNLSIIGIGVSGVLLALLGVRVCFLFNAATYLFSAVNIAMLAIPPRRAGEGASADEVRLPLRQELALGWKVVRETPEMRYAIFLWGFSTFIVGFEAPLFFPLVEAKSWGGASQVGYMYALACLGTMVTSLLLLRRATSPMRSRVVLGLVILADATAVLATALTHSYLLAAALCLGLGATETLFRTFSITEVQSHMPEHAAGRVFAAVNMVLEPSKTLAMVLSGLAVAGLSVVGSFVLASGVEYALAGFILIAAVLARPGLLWRRVSSK